MWLFAWSPLWQGSARLSFLFPLRPSVRITQRWHRLLRWPPDLPSNLNHLFLGLQKLPSKLHPAFGFSHFQRNFRISCPLCCGEVFQGADWLSFQLSLQPRQTEAICSKKKCESSHMFQWALMGRLIRATWSQICRVSLWNKLSDLSGSIRWCMPSLGPLEELIRSEEKKFRPSLGLLFFLALLQI